VDRSPFNLHVIRNFFEPETSRRLLEEMQSAPMSAAITYGKGDAAVDERVRRVKQVSVSEETIAYVSRRLEDQRASMANHFGISLDSFEPPQFLCYRVGDFFVAHQDGNTGLVNLDTDRTRRISVSVFLNNQSATLEPDTYSGGALIFSDWHSGKHYEVCGEAGMLVAFRSELTHEVTQVTQGKRFAVVSWFGTNGP
jgi:SM-20-related protein